MYKAGQPAQYILYCDQRQYRIYCAGWPALYTTDYLHLKFRILPSQLRQTATRAAGLCIKSLGERLASKDRRKHKGEIL
jgi:hypothetical protein